MQTTLDGKSRGTLSELVKLAIAVGEVREQNRWHSERIQSNTERITKLETDTRGLMSAVPSDDQPEKTSRWMRVFSRMNETMYALRTLWRIYKSVPWGVLILLGVAVWRKVWPLLSPWAVF